MPVEVFEREIEGFGSIRVFFDDKGEFCAVVRDVVLALGYKDLASSSKVTRDIDDKYKGRAPVSTPGGTQYMLYLTEEGLRILLSRSDKARARALQRWLDKRESGEVRALPESVERLPAVPDQPQSDFLPIVSNAVSQLMAVAMSLETRVAEMQVRPRLPEEYVIVNRAELESQREHCAHLEEKMRTQDAYLPVKSIPWLPEIFTMVTPYSEVQIGNELRRVGSALGIVPGYVTDQGGGIRRVFHPAVIARFKQELAEDPNLLRGLRQVVRQGPVSAPTARPRWNGKRA